MLDIKLIRQQPEMVQRKSEQKGYRVDVPRLLEVDKEKNRLKREIEALREVRKLNSEVIKLHKQIEAQETVLGPIIEDLKKEKAHERDQTGRAQDRPDHQS